MNTRCPLSARELVDEYFIENRTRLLEIAAFLDRLDRAESPDPPDFRTKAFNDALGMLNRPNRLDSIQLLLSDPTTEPLAALDRKSALGAYNERLRPERGDGVKPAAGRPPSESERGWGPASTEK